MSYGYHLLCVSGDPKTRKGEAHGYLTGLCYLAPHKLSGVGNVCPHASKGCATACLNTAGRGVMPRSQAARIRKTRLFFKDRLEFLRLLRFDIELLKATAILRRMTPALRLNGTSDIPWERFGVMEEHPSLAFYDYTKSYKRMIAFTEGRMPGNYHLTFSRSESNHEQCIDILSRNGNVAVVFRSKLPDTWSGFHVVAGDQTDLRFLDGNGVVIGLTAKGRAKRDVSGFVVD